MTRIELEDLPAFLAAARARDLRRVVLRVVSEVRPRIFDDHRVEVGPRRWCELVAYQGGTVLVVRLDDADSAGVEATLAAAGLAFRRVSDNIT